MRVRKRGDKQSEDFCKALNQHRFHPAIPAHDCHPCARQGPIHRPSGGEMGPGSGRGMTAGAWGEEEDKPLCGVESAGISFVKFLASA